LPSILHMERRAVSGLALAPIVKAGSRDVDLPEPFLNFGDVSLV